jgi:hypothetical protein
VTDSTRQGVETEAVLFERVFDEPVRVLFCAERQSDFGGLPLPAAIDRQMGPSRSGPLTANRFPLRTAFRLCVGLVAGAALCPASLGPSFMALAANVQPVPGHRERRYFELLPWFRWSLCSSLPPQAARTLASARETQMAVRATRLAVHERGRGAS